MRHSLHTVRLCLWNNAFRVDKKKIAQLFVARGRDNGNDSGNFAVRKACQQDKLQKIDWSIPHPHAGLISLWYWPNTNIFSEQSTTSTVPKMLLSKYDQR